MDIGGFLKNLFGSPSAEPIKQIKLDSNISPQSEVPPVSDNLKRDVDAWVLALQNSNVENSPRRKRFKNLKDLIK